MQFCAFIYLQGTMTKHQEKTFPFFLGTQDDRHSAAIKSDTMEIITGDYPSLLKLIKLNLLNTANAY